jgi:hypothetical protein
MQLGRKHQAVYLYLCRLTTVASCRHVYYLSWPLGFTISGALWLLLNTLWPPRGLREVDSQDVYGTFGPAHLDESNIENGKDEEFRNEDEGPEAGVGFWSLERDEMSKG